MTNTKDMFVITLDIHLKGINTKYGCRNCGGRVAHPPLTTCGGRLAGRQGCAVEQGTIYYIDRGEIKVRLCYFKGTKMIVPDVNICLLI